MIPALRRLIHAFFLDELAFRRWMRGGLLAFAGSGMAFGHDLADVLGRPGAERPIKVLAVLCGFIAGAMQSKAAKPKLKAVP